MICHLRGLTAAIVATMLIAATGAVAQSTLSGAYTVDGKQAALTQITAQKGDPESGKPVTVLVFTAKDQGKSVKPASDALFGELGDAIVAKVFADGTVYSADLVHAGFNLPNNTLTLFGGLKLADFSTANGQVSGHLSSEGVKEVRGQKYQFDLTFKTKAP